MPKLSLCFGSEGEPNAVHLSPQSFEGLPELTWLHIEYGIFSAKPGLFNRLNKLTFLSVYQCGFTEVPQKMLADFPHLSVLYLQENNITTITVHSFSELNADVSDISLDDNQISIIEPKSFDRLRNLTFLGLTGNQLVALPPGTFDGLQHLVELQLNWNKIATLDRHCFSSLLQLRILQLEHNKISSVAPETFTNMSLVELSLKSNKLENIPAGIFNSLTNLTKLDLRFNKCCDTLN